MPKDLSVLFYPKSVAVIGASRSPEKVGAIVLKNIVDSGYKGSIYPVNPNADTLNGLPCYKDIFSIPQTPELAVIALPAESAVNALYLLGDKGTKNVVVISAGFKETGEIGAQLESNLISASKKYNMNILGPNCLGFVNNLCPINVTFGNPSMIPGNLKFVTQSGAIATSLFDWCPSAGIDFSEFITLGNKSDINENDVLSYFLEQSKNTLFDHTPGNSSRHPAVGMYLESVSNGVEFLKIASELAKDTPIFVIKPGKSKAAAHAMQSHTGAIAGEDAVFAAALDQAGVIRCNSLEDFFDLSRSFAWNLAPEGPGVAIISNAGGPAVISADAVVECGLKLAELDPLTKDRLTQVLPRSASIYNPVDVLGDALADRYAQASEILLQNPQVNSLVVILTPQIMTQISKTAELIGELAKKYNKPVFCSFIGGSMVAEGEKILNIQKIPSYRFPERAIYAISKMWQFRQNSLNNTKSTTPDKIDVDEAVVGRVLTKIKADHGKSLDNVLTSDLLESAGISVPKTAFVEDYIQAQKWADDNGYPVVLKMSAPGLLHKKKFGGVFSDIKNISELKDAWERMNVNVKALSEEYKHGLKIQIQQFIPAEIEIIVGIKKDPSFGAVLLFGAGGSYAELIADRNLHLLPLNIEQAEQLVAKSKIAHVLKDLDQYNVVINKVCELMVRLGKLFELIPGASDIEINPVIISGSNVWAVDGKVVMEETIQKPVVGPKFRMAEVVSHENQASTFHYFDFKTDAPLILQPGQYVNVKVAPTRINCYSVAAQKSPTEFSLFVDVKPGGPGSQYFQALKVGDQLSFLGPFGMFTFKPDDGAENLLFLATGSGASPLRCMIENALEILHITKPIVLYIGLNLEEDIFWKDYLDNLVKKFPNFRYEIAIWKPGPEWKGHAGFITDIIKKDYPDASKCSAYLCGAKPMIDNAIPLLEQLGCPKERIYTEKY